MWHASTAGRFHLPEATLADLAGLALAGVGDPAAGEWREWTGRAYHLRRRLTEAEATRVGPVVDVRGTVEAERRLAVVRQWLPLGYTE